LKSVPSHLALDDMKPDSAMKAFEWVDADYLEDQDSAEDAATLLLQEAYDRLQPE